MKDYAIIADSTADLTPSQISLYGVNVIPMEFIIDGKSYINYPDQRELSNDEFYNKIKNKSSASTSQINVSKFTEYFENIINTGKDILYICFSSAMSGTYNCACIAARDLKQKYVDSKIEIVDSLSASSGEELLVYQAVENKKNGLDITENVNSILKTIKKIHGIFSVDDLNHLKRGGRISSTTAFFGTMMNIKPILKIDNKGTLKPFSKVRGRKQAIQYLFETMKENIVNPEDQIIYICHGDCLNDAQYLKDLIIKSKINVKDIVITYVGPIIGAHTGPGVIAIFFMGD